MQKQNDVYVQSYNDRFSRQMSTQFTLQNQSKASNRRNFPIEEGKIIDMSMQGSPLLWTAKETI